MSQQSYWKGGSSNALLGKAVVSPTGHVIAKNYDPKQLHEGDLGLSVRVDRKFEEMTSEQRMAAAGVADELTALLKRGVGAETDLGFQPGMVVRATNRNDVVHGLVERITPFSVLLRAVDPDGKLILKQLPLSVWTLEERHGLLGIEGLLARFLLEVDDSEGSDEHSGYDDFDWEIFAAIRDEELVKQCITEGVFICGVQEVVRHLASDALRIWALDAIERNFLERDQHDREILSGIALSGAMDPETIVSWFQNRTWPAARKPNDWSKQQIDGPSYEALDRLKELKASDEVFRSLIDENTPDVVMEDIARSVQEADLVLEMIELRPTRSEGLVAILWERFGCIKEHSRRILEAWSRPYDFYDQELTLPLVKNAYTTLDELVQAPPSRFWCRDVAPLLMERGEKVDWEAVIDAHIGDLAYWNERDGACFNDGSARKVFSVLEDIVALERLGKKLPRYKKLFTGRIKELRKRSTT